MTRAKITANKTWARYTMWLTAAVLAKKVSCGPQAMDALINLKHFALPIVLPQKLAESLVETKRLPLLAQITDTLIWGKHQMSLTAANVAADGNGVVTENAILIREIQGQPNVKEVTSSPQDFGNGIPIQMATEFASIIPMPSAMTSAEEVITYSQGYSK